MKSCSLESIRREYIDQVASSLMVGDATYTSQGNVVFIQPSKKVHKTGLKKEAKKALQSAQQTIDGIVSNNPRLRHNWIKDVSYYDDSVTIQFDIPENVVRIGYIKRQNKLAEEANRLQGEDGNYVVVDGEIHHPDNVDTDYKEIEDLKKRKDLDKDILEDSIDEIRTKKYQEENIRREIDSRKRGFSSATAIVDKPDTENFEQVLIWKSSQLNDVNNNLERSRIALQNSNDVNKAKKLRDTVKTLEARKDILEEQITFLNENSEDLSVQTVLEDLDLIQEALSTSDIHEVDQIRKAIDFYQDFILNVVSDDIKKKIASKLGEIRVDYIKDLETKIKAEVMKESSVVRALENLNKDPEARKKLDKKPGEEITIDDLFVASKDISSFDKNLFGLLSSQTGDGILPQFLLHSYKKALNRWENFVYEQHIDKLREFNNHIDGRQVDRKSLLETDEDGIPTGNLVNLTSTKWEKALKERAEMLSDFLTAKYKKKQLAYFKLINWHKANSEIIEFYHLPQIAQRFSSDPEYRAYFTKTNSQMEAYEQEMREILGPLYDSYIQRIIVKLDKYDQFLKEEAGTERFEERKERQNIWKFTKNYVDGKTSEFRKSEEGYNIYYSYFNDITFIPKKTLEETSFNDLGEWETREVDSGYYSKDFENIKKDSLKTELWSIFRDMSEFINATYDIENFGKVKAPMIAEQYHERVLNGFKSGRSNKYGRVGKAIRESKRALQAIYYERGTKTEGDTGIIKNQADNSKSLILQATKAKMLLGMSQEQADKEARSELFQTYSEDLDRAFEVSLTMAAAHQARMELEPIADLAKDYLQHYDKDRKNSLARVESWVDKVIKNKSFSSREVGGEKDMTIEWYEKLKTKAQRNRQMANIFRKLTFRQPLGEITGIIVPKKIMTLLSDQEKVIVDTFEKLSINDLKDMRMSDNIGDKSFYFERTTDEHGVTRYYLDKPEDGLIRYDYPEEDFKRYLTQYIAVKMDAIGLSLNISGVSDGILTSILIAGMGLKFTTGAYQRLEGKTTNLIADAEGWYWTAGNLSKASSFMAWMNITDIATSRIKNRLEHVKRRQQIEIFKQLTERMSIFQQRSDELQKSSDGVPMLDMFAISISIPEFKNQGEVALAMMMDFEIKDNEGNVHKFFDGENFEFTAYTTKNGVLTLKPEFSELDLSSDHIQDMVLGISSAIKEIHGNYDRSDTFKFKEHWSGRGFTQFFTWFPEYYNARLGTIEKDDREEIAVNLGQGKRKIKGRYLRAADASKASTTTFVAISTGVAFGLGGAYAAIPFGLFMMYKMFQQMSSQKSIQRDVNSILKLANFIESIAIETINLPLKVGSAAPLSQKLKINNKTFSNKSLSDRTLGKLFKESDYNTLSEAEIGALKGMSLELAVMIQGLMLKLAVGAMLYDSDEDELSHSRMRYNFIQNQLSKYVNTYNAIGAAPELWSGSLENGVAGHLEGLYHALDAIAGRDYKGASIHAASMMPIPGDIRNYLFRGGNLPWENRSNYDENVLTNPSRNLSWVTRSIKDEESDGEFYAKREFNRLKREEREKIKRDFRSISGDKEFLKIISENILKERYYDKRSAEKKTKKEGTYKLRLELYEQEGKNTTTSRKKLKRELKNKLKNTNLTEEQRDYVIEKRFSRY